MAAVTFARQIQLTVGVLRVALVEAEQELVHVLRGLPVADGVVRHRLRVGKAHARGLLDEDDVGALRPRVGVGDEGQAAVGVRPKAAGRKERDLRRRR